MPDTVTSFTVFIPGTKARSNEVNQNFNNYRGTLLPISTDTATSSNSTHDIGSSDHRWRTAFCDEVNLTPSTSTAALLFGGDAAATIGAFSWKIDGTEVLRVTPQGLESTATVYHHALKTRPVSQTGANTGPAGIITSPYFLSSGVTLGVGLVAGSTVTIALTGRPVMIGLGATDTTTGSFFSVERTYTTTGSMQARGALFLYRNTTTSVVAKVLIEGPEIDVGPVTTTAGKPFIKSRVDTWPGVITLDVGLTNGSNTYFLGMTVDEAQSTAQVSGHLWAYEVL